MDTYSEENAFLKLKEELECSDEAAAMLVLAATLRTPQINYDDLSHAICMALRKGLFGAGAKDFDSIRDLAVDSKFS